MTPAAHLVLAVNPGAGSTKLGLFRGEERLLEETVRHEEESLAGFARVMDQLPLRAAAVKEFLVRALPPGGRLGAAVGRGGLLGAVESGTFAVGEAMVAELERAERGEHASNLGAPLARKVAEEHGCPAFIVDPVSVDELWPVARVTGIAGVERRSLSHALNIRAVARRHARGAGRRLGDLRLVVAHLGTGVSLAALAGGRMVDVVNPQDEGPFSGDRAGGVPAMAVVELCFSPGAERGAVRRRLFGDGGLASLLGTRDAREVVGRVEAGDPLAALVLDAMCYQIAKAAAGLAAALEGRVDAILLTGGMAHLGPVVEGVRRRVAFIGPVAIHPGEDELRALCEGALRVLAGEEPARAYPPPGRG